MKKTVRHLYLSMVVIFFATALSCFIAAIYFLIENGINFLTALFLTLFIINVLLSINFIQTNQKFLTFEQKRKIKNFLPPFISVFISNFVNKTNRDDLIFDGNEDLFRHYLTECSVYGEYGMGGSTIEALKSKDIFIYSVDSDINWVTNLQRFQTEEKHILKYVCLGEMLDWGYPKDYSQRGNIKQYLNYIWQQEKSPDLVVIDGRFRVASFLVSLKNCKAGTRIIFDDYIERHSYHVIEELIKPTHFFGRQVIFEIASKESIDTELLDYLIDKFEYVMD